MKWNFKPDDQEASGPMIRGAVGCGPKVVASPAQATAMIAAVPQRDRALGDRVLGRVAPRQADRAALVDQLGVRSLAQLAPDGRCFGPAFEGSWPTRAGTTR